jgi:hypothetical protein
MRQGVWVGVDESVAARCVCVCVRVCGACEARHIIPRAEPSKKLIGVPGRVSHVDELHGPIRSEVTSTNARRARCKLSRQHTVAGSAAKQVDRRPARCKQLLHAHPKELAFDLVVLVCDFPQVQRTEPLRQPVEQLSSNAPFCWLNKKKKRNPITSGGKSDKKHK